MLLASKIYIVNERNLDQFVFSIQFDVKEPKTYIREIKGLNAAQLAKAIKEELYQLHKNEIWILVPKTSFEPGPLPIRRQIGLQIKVECR